MREINVPSIHQHFSEVIDLENIKESQIQIVNGARVLSFGTVDIGRNMKELEVAKNNGAKLIFGTIAIEKCLNQIIAAYYFVSNDESINPKEDEFKRDILESSALEYSFKKELVKTLIGRNDQISNDAKKTIEKNLKDVMVWRNAFAHGSLNYSQDSGCVLEYYSGGHKSIILNDEFWNKAEKCYIDTNTVLNEIVVKLGNRKTEFA